MAIFNSRSRSSSVTVVKFGVSKTALLRSLEKERSVARDEGGSLPQPWRPYELGGTVVDSYDLASVVRSALEALSGETSGAVLRAGTRE